METETKTPSLIYEVTFGAVFKISHEGRQVLAMSKRDRKGHWLPAHEITDHPGVYKSLAVDQCAVVYVESKDDVHKMKDIYALTLNADGDTTTVARAVQEKKLGGLLEKSFRDWIKKGGPILSHDDETRTYLWPDDLTARYDYSQLEALRKAYALEIKEGAEAEHMPHIEKAITKFNSFLDKMEPEDELFWFEHLEPLADRIGYVILRKGRAVSAHIVLMS